MNEREIKRILPRASKSFVQANADPQPVVEKKNNRGKNQFPAWTENDERALKLAYGCDHQIFSVDQIAKALGRTYAGIVCKANELGLCNENRGKSDSHRATMSRDRKGKPGKSKGKKIWADKPHPRGMLGKTHSLEAREKISVAHAGKKVPRERVLRQIKTHIERYGRLAPLNGRGSWRSGWTIVGSIRFYARSLWEANYARYLEFLKSIGEIKSWQYESRTFWFEKIKRGSVSYLPDFEVTLNDGSVEYHEVKGWMDTRSKTKIRRMRKYYPLIKLIVRDSKWFKSNWRKLAGIVAGWEEKTKKKIPIAIT